MPFSPKIFYSLLVILLLAAVIFFFSSGTDVKDLTNYPPRNRTIVAFGDSLVAGTGASEGHDFVTLLAQKIDRPIRNLGRPGRTTAQGLAEIDEVIGRQPGIVLVLLGGNDYLRRVPRAETFHNLEQIVTQLQESGAVVVLLGVQGGVLGDGFANEFEKLSEERKTGYVPNVLDGIIGHANLMFDTIHPNDAGYALVAEKVAPLLQQLTK